MTMENLMKEIELFQFSPLTADVKDGSTLPQLYDLFVKSNHALQPSSKNVDNLDIANQADEILVAQDMLIDLAATLEAHSTEDLLIKMALWRRQAPELDQALEHMTGADAIAYSVFRDLVKLTGKLELLTDIDLDIAA